ncbi:hypothetical protein AB6878_12670 [Carnobacterium maltaromaticum]|uniref:hypothetical protein n=1 Tax=Carnobacterium maltaromaticum TaxID=2751 RepID=UPI0039BE47EA
MKIYIVKNTQRITDYSTIKNGSFSIEVNLPEDSNPINFIWNGSEAVFDEFIPPEVELTEIEQLQKENELLKKGLEEANERQDMTDAAMLELADVVFGGGE